MLGSFYHQREQEVLQSTTPTQDKESYAAHLLADILNRASVLEAVAVKYGMLRDEPAECQQTADELAQSVQMFLEDVAECRLRGRKVNLFAGNGPDVSGVLPGLVDADCTEPHITER